MKRFIVLLMILGMVSISQAIMLADFETGLDGFLAINSPLVTLTNPTAPAGAITSGAHCLKIQTAGSNYWSLQWTPPTIPTKLKKLSFDTTMFAADWPAQPWTKFPDKIAININGGWSEIQLVDSHWKNRDGTATSADWGAWAGDAFKTCTVDLSSYNMTGATSFSITISINCGTAGIFYLDNLHFVDEPYDPTPTNGGSAVAAGTDTLSWTNAIQTLEYVQVWFGEAVGAPTDPNYPTLENYKTQLTMISKIADPGASSTAAIPVALEIGKTYAWVVDGFYNCGDPNENTEPNYPGVLWTFVGTSHNPPVANAGADQYIYDYADVNDIVITLDGSASTDDGQISPLTHAWTQTGGPAATIDTPNAAITTVTLTGGLANNTEDGAAEPYVFQLVVDDGQFTDPDDVTVFVNSSSCTASIEAGGFYYYGDIASATEAGVPDCKVDLYDFAELALNWLGCTDTFEGCD